MNRQQFISYVEGCQKALRRFLTALCCGDTRLADDIAQETLIKAWLSSDDFRGDAAFATWIRRIAYNTWLNHRRHCSDSLPLDSAADLPDNDTPADSAFRYQALYRALAMLSDKERTSTLLYYMEGYSIKEIAEIEAVNPDAVRQHLSRARTRLRSLLSPS